MDKRARGFTLAEALVSMAILALLLGLAASVFVGYTRITRQSKPHERNLVLGYNSLDRMRTEVSSCVALFDPAPNPPPSMAVVNSNVLGFEKVDPSVVNRLPDPPVPGGTFEPLDPAANCQVRYEVVDGKLLRKAWGSGWTSDELLMEGVVGLAVSFRPPAGLVITLNLQEERNTRTLTGYSYIWSRE